MVRSRTTAASAVSKRRRASANLGEPGSLLQTAERMVTQIEGLVGEIASLRADNHALRAELRDAVAMLSRASEALGGVAAPRRGRGRPRSVPGDDAASSASGARRRRPAKPSRGRATPPEVTPEVVRGTIGKLGTATASEIAAEISRHTSVAVTGRAIRFLAERAGATIETVDGQRRYRLG